MNIFTSKSKLINTLATGVVGRTWVLNSTGRKKRRFCWGPFSGWWYILWKCRMACFGGWYISLFTVAPWTNKYLSEWRRRQDICFWIRQDKRRGVFVEGLSKWVVTYNMEMLNGLVWVGYIFTFLPLQQSSSGGVWFAQEQTVLSVSGGRCCQSCIIPKKADVETSMPNSASTYPYDWERRTMCIREAPDSLRYKY